MLRRAVSVLVLAMVGYGELAAAQARPRRQTLTYCAPGGQALQLDLYRPVGAGSHPVVLFLYGGAWFIGSRQDAATEYATLRNALLAGGFAVAVPDYRLAPKHRFPAMIQDAKCAVRFLRANAQRLRLDGARMGAFGYSAGGHLAMLVGYAHEAGWDDGEHRAASSAVQAVANLAGGVDYRPSSLHAHVARGIPKEWEHATGFWEKVTGTADFRADIHRAFAPLSHVAPDGPPLLFLQMLDDEYNAPAHASLMAQRLAEAKIPGTFVYLPGRHADSVSAASVARRVADHFRQILRRAG